MAADGGAPSSGVIVRSSAVRNHQGGYQRNHHYLQCPCHWHATLSGQVAVWGRVGAVDECWPGRVRPTWSSSVLVLAAPG